MKKVAILTFGCKINQYESSCIIDSFVNEDYQVVDFSEEADIYIINSCTVTARTDFKSRNAIRKALKRKDENNEIQVIATGCYVQRNPEEAKKLGVDHLVDNNKKDKILALINGSPTEFEDILQAEEFDEYKTRTMINKSRAFIKVQDGCDFYCAYCAIPYARGHSRSRKVEDVIDQINILTEQGYEEVVLGGINMGLYGHDLSEATSLAKLLEKIENETKIKQIRLSSVEPQLFQVELLDFLKTSKKICPHFHIPLQVGNDVLLKNMNRRYSTELFAKLMDQLNEIFPNVAIGVDVIVGLPGETEELFNQTKNFLASLPITSLHVFSYSKRPGTEAEKMKDHLPNKIKNLRANELISLSDRKTKEFYNKIISEHPILYGVAENVQQGMQTAMTNNGLKVYCESRKELESKKIYKMKPSEIYLDGIKVEIID